MNGETQPVTLIDLLDRLIEAPEPQPVSMMPQTWGWVVVVAILLLAGVVIAVRLRRRYRANAYRRDALRELDAARHDPAAIADILRRTALAAYPRRNVAGLAGEDWLRFLDEHGPGKDFSQGPGRLVAEAPYRTESEDPALYRVARSWVARHRTERAA